ncbi:MAG: M28 family peptidase [Acidobacteria bacterium]|nr:M28 family peptidase [Acidobacteriota bacterium]
MTTQPSSPAGSVPPRPSPARGGPRAILATLLLAASLTAFSLAGEAEDRLWARVVPGSAISSGAPALPGVEIVLPLKAGYLARVTAAALPSLAGAGFTAEVLERDRAGSRPVLVYRDRPGPRALPRLGDLHPLEEGTFFLLAPAGVSIREALPPQDRFAPLRALSGAEHDAPVENAPAGDPLHPLVAPMVSRVATADLVAWVQALQDFGTRECITPQCELAAVYLLGELGRFNLMSHLEAFTIEDNGAYPVHNVIGVVPGVVSPSRQVVICGHFDDYTGGPVAPGADDNASGTAGVLEMAKIFSDYDFECTLVFACFTGEEYGLLGSEDYAAKARSANQDIKAVLNMDMIAYNSGPPNYVDFYVNTASSWIGQRMLEIGPLFNSPDVVTFSNFNRPTMRGSDHASFWDQGYPAVCVIEDLHDFHPDYHTVGDTLDKLNLPYFTGIVKTVTAMAADTARPVGLNGDLDASGAVTDADAADGASALAGNRTVGPRDDVKRDGAVNILDLMRIRRLATP